MLRDPSRKRAKFEETKEINLQRIEDSSLNQQICKAIDDLKELLDEYKAKHAEDLKYKRKIDELVSQGVINKNLEEVIKF